MSCHTNIEHLQIWEELKAKHDNQIDVCVCGQDKLKGLNDSNDLPFQCVCRRDGTYRSYIK